MATIEPLATTADYEARYGAVGDDLKGRIGDRLLDATVLVLRAMPGYEPGGDPVLDRAAQAVCCSVVHRALDREDRAEGVSQYQQTAGVYNASVSFANPDGTLYLGASDRAMLGLDSGVVLTVGMEAAPCAS